MLPAGVDTRTPSATSFFIKFFFLILIFKKAVCLLCLNNETSLIDTPGIRGFGLVKIDRKDISKYFPEFVQNQHKCKYSNCVHINEPSCEIKKLISSGVILLSRYDNYCSMFRSEDIYR